MAVKEEELREHVEAEEITDPTAAFVIEKKLAEQDAALKASEEGRK